jgi:ubiquinone/menaquinone biosynthesis C-methylase UbiE/uncharacterized protein YbaR (Trm112 family)
MTTDRQQFDDLLACPRCDKTPLAAVDGGYRCKGCKTRYPDLNGIPWLFAEPVASLAEWRNRLQYALQQLAQESQRMRVESNQAGLSELTKQRLTSLIDANDRHRADLRKLLAAVDVQSMEATYESHLALRTRLPGDQGLNTYYANVHRDWAWGDAENTASAEAIAAILEDSGSAETGDALVLGAGAGRLAYDLHQRPGSARTIAVDFNPLLLLIAQRVISGESLELYEFPIAPNSMQSCAVLQTLAAPCAADDGLHLVLADVLRAPFAAGSVDTVVTPWLIDIVSEDLPVFASRINRLLKPGGRWINFGSLAFDHPERARRYSPDEVIDIVGNSGFSAPQTRESTIPYMCSPHSRHGRQETVFTFAAVKEKSVDLAERHKALPDWIVVGKQPVPLTQSFGTQAMTSRVYSFVMSLIDGKRSIEEMAVIFEQQKLMTQKEAVPAIRNFLTRMYEDSQRNSNF